MRKIYIFDTTLRDGEQSPGVNLNTQEKVEIALQLEKLGVDRMEAGFPAASPGDLAAVNAVARAVKNATVIGLSRSREQDIDAVREALKGAQDPCIHLVPCYVARFTASISCGWRSSRCWKRRNARFAMRRNILTKSNFRLRMLAVRSWISYAKLRIWRFRAGATVVNIPDTVGYMNP